MSRLSDDERKRMFMLGHSEARGVPGAMTEDAWPKVVDAAVRILVVHRNALYESDPQERRENWIGWCEGRWTDFNGGGWVWYGLAGTVTHVAPIEAAG